METIKVTKNDAKKRLDNFLLKKYNNIPKSVVFKWIRKSIVKVNNNKCEVSYRLVENDIVTINVNDNIINQKNPVTNLNFIKQKPDIVYEDENIVLMNKPIGLLSQDDANKNILTMQNIFLKYLIDTKQYDPNKENVFVPSICNRLDRNTSGIIIAAKNSNALTVMNELIKNHQVQKYYLAMVYKKPKKDHELLYAYHFKNSDENIVYISDEKKLNYSKIITEYWLKESNNKYSVLEVKLITGKTHQIRAHLNHIGLSIVGDSKYRDKDDDIDTRITTQALVSYKIKFNVDSKYKALNYLDGKKFEIKDIWFLKFFN